MFIAINTATGEAAPIQFPNGEVAREWAKQKTKETGCKWQPRPVKADDAWKKREAIRMENGSYKPLPWATQDWWVKHGIKDHFAHISVKDAGKVAFTRDAKGGAADIQVSMKPGRYLTEFYLGILTAEQIRTLDVNFSMEAKPMELKFAFSPEEIEKVYKQPGLGSCFSETTKANLYGSGDFAVAYIERNGKVTARAVCAPSVKRYVRPYGDTERIDRLLKEAGYKNTGDSKHFDGLRLLKKWHWPGFYTDFGGRVVPHPTDEEYLIIRA